MALARYTRRRREEAVSSSPKAIPHSLSPTQQAAFESLERQLAAHSVTVLSARPGMGKTRILHALLSGTGGVYLTSRELVEASAQRHPLALDETIYDVLRQALDANDTVIVDDFQLVSLVACCAAAYPRQHFIAAALLPLATFARDRGKRLVFTAEGMPLTGLHERFPTVSIGAFTVADYAAICASYLGEAARRIDYGKVHRFAPKLNARQLRNTCVALCHDEALGTDRFVEYLREHHMVSNVDIAEVQAADLNDLKGLDDVLEALEANVIMPLENADVSQELGLQPKRGVLLAGPPGTGKTTIGRALARRLKSKFFLLDGTVISGTPEFFPRVHHIFEAAKQNAPSIIFIDDSDVIFETSGDAGLYRYLLTMLDGLESTSAGRICLIMTAMDVGNLPPALVRSGRIELWLETCLPPVAARVDILRDHCARLPAAIRDVDVDAIAAASDGLAGADLKRVVEDGKLLFAFDREKRGQTRPATTYFVQAVETVRRNKQQYANAEARARARRPHRPAFFDPMSALAAFAVHQAMGEAGAADFGPGSVGFLAGSGQIMPEGDE
jgi:transitional endoplasmic reticulum ATPase